MGGNESLSTPGSRRVSRDDSSRKSIDAIVRRSVDRVSRERSRRRLWRMGRRRGSSGGSSVAGGAADNDHPGDLGGEGSRDESRPSMVMGLTQDQGLSAMAGRMRTSYLLVSPLLGTVAGLATMSLSTLWTSHPTHHLPNTSNLTQNPTLIIYGTEDFFTSAKKVRRWCAALGRESLSFHGQGGFRSREVACAGHFWREEGVEEVLRGCVGGWVGDVVVNGGG